jgi:methionine-S-sulfoxide reductase
MKAIVYGILVAVPVMLLVSAASPAAPEPAPGEAKQAKAVFAGGCFWCMEHPFDELPGVVSVTPGYAGGEARNPTYEQVSAGRTGHAESVEVVYDPAKISYKRLLEVFWRNVDPTDAGGQFCDRGTQYRSARSSGKPRRSRCGNSRRTSRSRERSRRRSSPRRNSGPRRSITGITTRRTPSGTSITGRRAVVTRG